MNLFILLALLICFDISTAANDTACGDWEPYKGEHCYKVFDKAGLQSFGDAEKTCQRNGATLISIHFREEQDFLTNYIFTEKKAVDNVWIGAKFAGSKFQWQDKSDLTFTNWATGSPKKLADYCVQMHSDVGSVGKWVDEPCAKKNLVVCQKRPTWPPKLLEEMVIELTHGLQRVNQKLTETQTKLSETQIKVAGTQTKLIETEKTLVETKHKFVELENKFENSKTNPVPVGFTYVQLPKDKSPKEIWPSMSWTDVSSDYAGVFFRVEGGDAAAFGTKQSDNAPRLTGVKYDGGVSVDRIDQIQTKLGDWSDWCYTAIHGTGGWASNSYQMSSGEVRPVNMAIRVWKRTG